MNFLEDIFARLETAENTVLWELHDQEERQEVSFGLGGRGLLKQIDQGRAFLRSKGLKKG